MVVLDNKATATSGFQVNLGVGKDAMGKKVPALDIEKISRACGVENIYTVDPDEIDSRLEKTFKKALGQTDLALVIIRMPVSKEIP